jgi:hypothetical protein
VGMTINAGEVYAHLVRDVREGTYSPIALHARPFLAVTSSPPRRGAGSHARLPAIAYAERTLAPWRRSMELWYRTVH